ncbi:MAG: hypothetical protein HY907_21295 [Deltaproteobacteria bacterium]|nr:hypothetical protein [Deltaproteobacteria bacterium]
MAHTIDILFFDGCPHVERARRVVRLAIAWAGVAEPVAIREIRVADDGEARSRRFLGSPTVRVDDCDVDATGGRRDDFGIQCRIYETDGRLVPAPPVEWIVAALCRQVVRSCARP